MKDFAQKIKTFLGSPAGKFVLDIMDTAIVGAAFAAIALPDNITAKDALGLIVGGSIGTVKAFARLALVQFLSARKAAGDPAAQTTTTP